MSSRRDSRRERRTKRRLDIPSTSRAPPTQPSSSTPSSSSHSPPRQPDERSPWPRNPSKAIQTVESYPDPRTVVRYEAFLRNLQDVPRRVPGERRAPATQGPPEAPVHDFPIMPDIPMRDHGDFQRFVADALQAICSRVSRCRCMSRRSVRAHDPAAPGRSHQYRRDSSSDDEDAAKDSD
ncbi:hypothetical protein Bca4012_063452 [Brassica carinata]